MNLNILKNIGFTDGELKIYNALLELGAMPAGEIIKKTALGRGDAYNKIYDLKKKGLVEEFSKDKKKYFRLEHPNKIEDYITEKTRDIEDSKKQVDLILPELINQFTFASNKPGIKYFYGVEGMKQAYLDTLTDGVQDTGIKAIVSPSDPHPDLARWLKNHYVKKRIQKSIKAFVIASSSSDALSYKSKDKKESRETILVSNQKYPFKMEIDIYAGNKVLFISFSKEEMAAFMIESKAVYQTMQAFFDLNWHNLKQQQSAHKV